MSDLDFVKEFRKIQITRICKKVGVDYCNFISGRSSKKSVEKVKNELLKQINKLVNTEQMMDITLLIMAREIGTIMKELQEANEEIERLKAQIELEEDNRIHLNKLLEKKDNIIKEVREWVYKIQQDNKRLEPIIATDELDEILEVLDKGK